MFQPPPALLSLPPSSRVEGAATAATGAARCCASRGGSSDKSLGLVLGYILYDILQSFFFLCRYVYEDFFLNLF